MTIPKVKAETAESIIQEVYTKNAEFGIKDFESKLETENIELAWVIYSFLDSITESIYTDEHLRDEVCALSKICCHLLYKSLEKQLEINEMENQ